jgi:hypothetical protein
MIVEEDVVYRATVRLHGERVERLRVVKERVPFVVEEHPASSMVPVCRWTAPARGSAVEGDTLTRISEVVAVDGGFFTMAGGRPGDPDALRRMLDGFGVFKREFFDEFSLQAGAYRPAEVVDLSRAAVASIEPYDRRRWVGALERKVAGFALLDGRLHRRESEPVLVAGTNGSGLPGKAHMERIGRSVGTPTVVPAWSADVADGSKGRGVFRLDRLDDAVAFAAAYASRSVDEVKVSGTVELLDRNSLRLDDEIFALAAGARQAVRHLGGELTWMPRPAVDAVFDLRDMLGWPDLHLDLLVDASERMLENLRPFVADPNSERNTHLIRDVVEQMDEAVERIAASRPADEAAPGLGRP